jgi:uncharacterized membrane protein YobD (UPF0266 family)
MSRSCHPKGAIALILMASGMPWNGDGRMIGSDTPDFGANRSGVFVEEGEDRSTLTLYARNRLVSWVVSVLAVFLATGALSLAANGLRASDYLTAFVMVGVALAVVWLTWYVGWRKRPFHIVFITDHLEVGRQSIAYSDIQSVGLSRDGGDAYDPASMPVPRNYTAGPYVYVQLPRRLPSPSALDHHLLDLSAAVPSLGDGRGVQALGAGLGAVHDRVAAVELERVF